MHTFWLFLFVPAVILGQWIWPVLKQRSIWFVLTLVLGTLVFGWLAMGFPALKSSQWTATEIGKMFAFRLAAYTDLPLLQLLIASVAGWIRGRGTPVTQVVSADAEPQLAAISS